MALTNVEMAHQTSKFISRVTSIGSDCCRLPTTRVLSNKADKSVLINTLKFVKDTFQAEIRKIEIPRSMVVVEA